MLLLVVADSEVGTCSWCWRLLNPYLILGALIWLGVVTVALLALCVAVCCCRRRDAHHKAALSYSNGSVTGWNHKDLWKTNYEEIETSSKPGYENTGLDSSYYVEEGRTAF